MPVYPTLKHSQRYAIPVILDRRLRIHRPLKRTQSLHRKYFIVIAHEKFNKKINIFTINKKLSLKNYIIISSRENKSLYMIRGNVMWKLLYDNRVN